MRARISRVVSEESNKKCYKVIGFLLQTPKVGEELQYKAFDGKQYGAQEIIESVKINPVANPIAPGRIIITTEINEFIVDDFGIFNENSRRGSWLK